MADGSDREIGSFAFKGIAYGIAFSALLWMTMISGFRYFMW